MSKSKKIMFINISCPTNANLENLKTIAIAAEDSTFFEVITYANTLETVKNKLSKWILSFNETVYINSTRQKEVEVLKALLKDTPAQDKVVVKVYLKMIFEDMFKELREKGLSLLRISFLYDLSQKEFENEVEKQIELENNGQLQMSSVDTTDMVLAKCNLKALSHTIQYLKNLPNS